MKTCTLCKIEKSETEFSKRKDQKDGLHFWCKPCLKIKKAESYQKNRDKALANMARYRADNPEKVAAAKKASYLKKPDHYKLKHAERYAADPARAAAITKKWKEENEEYVKVWSAAYRKRNRAALNAKQLEYYKANKEKIIAYQGKYISERYKTDVLFAVQMLCRRRLLFAFSKGGYKKNTKTETILGCTFAELVSHLEAQFSPGMTWDNRGMYGWHIDHIVPLSSASSAEELEKLSHYTNLQPLWASDNWSKGAKMPTETECEAHDHGRLDYVQADGCG